MRILVTTGIFFFIQSICFAQSLSDLQQKKQNAVKNIGYTTRLLNQTQEQARASLNRLQLLNRRISQRNRLLSGLAEEMNVYREFIESNRMVVDLLRKDIQQLKDEYAALIRRAYRHRNSNDVLMFLLSAEDFNQAYRRFLYMRHYSAYRKKQAETIGAVESLLNEKIRQLEKHQQAREKLMEEVWQENQKLTQEKNKKQFEIRELETQQHRLQQRLNEHHRREQQLEREIQQMIRAGARKNRGPGEPAFALTPEQKLVGDHFEQNRSRLPWPVERGIITERFGIHPHPVLSKVQIRNNGIKISTEIGAPVRAVFKGVVSRVFGITGGNSAVIIRHGKYLSVYSNLLEVTVKKGDQVSAKQPIGKVYTDYGEGGKSILKFQIWQEDQKLNPEEWIVQ